MLKKYFLIVILVLRERLVRLWVLYGRLGD